MSLLFLTHAGRRLGMGHLKRCLRLAGRVRERGAEASFAVLCRAQDESMLDSIRAQGFDCRRADPEIPLISAVACSKPGLVAADLLDRDLSPLRSQGWRVLAFDCYTAGANLYVNILDDPSFSPSCPTYYGYRYWMIDPPAQRLQRVSDSLQRILISCGYSDPLGTGPAAAKSIRRHFIESGGIAPDIICAVTDKHNAVNLRALESIPGIRLEWNLPSLEGAMLESDLLVTAGGNTMIEGIAAAVPVLVLPAGERNARLAHQLEAKGFLDVLEPNSPADWSQAMTRLTLCSHRSELHRRCLEFDGFGLDRVCTIVLREQAQLGRFDEVRR